MCVHRVAQNVHICGQFRLIQKQRKSGDYSLHVTVQSQENRLLASWSIAYSAIAGLMA
jgi:hypothetical protein